ncbi:MAG: DUF1269 domain-containing protein [Pseudomonadota bacterium]|nr:DUF1269 domain-containing protein [Pseudomonadota bacterium]
MNRLLFIIFDNESSAEAGTRALKQLHAEGDITLYAWSVVAKDAQGAVTVKQTADRGIGGIGVGMAVGSLIGLLGGPVGLALGALAGTVVGALRDSWAAGVGLDFVEQANKDLQPGKVAVIAEVEEEWVLPVDSRMEAAGGTVFRRARADLADAQLDRDVGAFNAEIAGLQAEVARASGDARTKLQAQLARASAGLDSALQRTKHQVDEVKRESEARIGSLEAQLAQTQGHARQKLDERIARVRAAWEERAEKLERAWKLTREAMTP